LEEVLILKEKYGYVAPSYVTFFELRKEEGTFLV